MPHVRNRLTVRTVQAADAPRLYADGGGLNLQVAKGGSKSWIYRFTLRGRAREMGLGSVLDMTLAEARAAADEARRLVRDGIDPIEKRKADRAAIAAAPSPKPTFWQCCESFLKAHQHRWRNSKSSQQWRNTLTTYAKPILGALPVDTIDTHLVKQVIEPLWSEKTETAKRVRGRIEAVLDWAGVSGYRTGENPARWHGHLKLLLPPKSSVKKVKHHKDLEYKHVSEFMSVLQKRNGVSARGLEFLILTACRASEVAGCRWQEINFDDKIWTLPPDRMKSGQKHEVPLTDKSLCVLKEMAEIRQNDFVFPGQAGNSHLWIDSFRSMIKKMGYDGYTTHGFRSTFRD